MRVWDLKSRIWGFWIGVDDLEFWVEASEARVWVLRLRIWGLGFRVERLGLRIWGLGLRPRGEGS